ncbi:MAG TPA: biotin/lipoyl-binding protein, partial [bacterium]|nr:biotin/lipoyl-binding protein [bacterium]
MKTGDSYKQWMPGALLLAALVAGGLQTGCEKPKAAAQENGAPEVAVFEAAAQQVVLTTELPGRTTAYLVAEIRPQVSGLIQERLFEEGSDVQAGQPLYQIDPAPFQAALDNAQANLAAARKSADR